MFFGLLINTFLWAGMLGIPSSQEPPRIVSLVPSLTELLFAIHAENLVVGVSRYDDQPAQVNQLPRIGGFFDPDLERIVALQPTWVLTSPGGDIHQQLQQLKDFKTNIKILPLATLTDIVNAIDVLADITQQWEAAALLKNQLQSQLTAITQHKQTACPTLMVVGHHPLRVVGPTGFLNMLIHMAGGRNVVTRGGITVLADMEILAVWHPDVIIDLTEPSMQLQDLSIIQKLLRTNMNSPAPFKYVRLHPSSFRPGPRLPQGLQALVDAMWSSYEDLVKR